MAFWTHRSTALDELQPKLKDRFLIIMGGQGAGTPFSYNIMFTAKSIDKPSVTIETKDFKLMNHKFKYPGQATWSPIKITMVDMAGKDDWMIPKKLEGDTFAGGYVDSEIRWNKEQFDTFGNPNFQNTGAALAYLLYGSGYDTPNFTAAPGKSNNTGIKKDHFKTMLQNLTIQQLSHTPVIQAGDGPMNGKIIAVEQWTFKNPIIKSISWGSLGYGEDGLVEYTIEIDYDFAEVSFNRETVGHIITR